MKWENPAQSSCSRWRKAAVDACDVSAVPGKNSRSGSKGELSDTTRRHTEMLPVLTDTDRIYKKIWQFPAGKTKSAGNIFGKTGDIGQ